MSTWMLPYASTARQPLNPSKTVKLSQHNISLKGQGMQSSNYSAQGRKGRQHSWFINRQTSLSLMWVAGHMGSIGNDAADKLAKVATKFRLPDEDLLLNFLKGTLPNSMAASKQYIRHITEINTEKWWKHSKCYK